MSKAPAFFRILCFVSVFSTISLADIKAPPCISHTCFGIGLAVDQLPVSMASLTIPLSYFAYEHQFMDPTKGIRVGMETGVFGFYGTLPIPEVGANLYLGSEKRMFQGKIGAAGFYDLFVGGHGGLATKIGTIIQNRIGVDIIIVPLAVDSKRSYQEALGLESKEKADEYFNAHGYHVKTPYFGLLASLRF